MSNIHIIIRNLTLSNSDIPGFVETHCAHGLELLVLGTMPDLLKFLDIKQVGNDESGYTNVIIENSNDLNTIHKLKGSKK